MRNMKIITCLLTITSLVFTACGGGSNDIEKAKKRSDHGTFKAIHRGHLA